MKKLIITLCIPLALFLRPVTGWAQEEPVAPHPVPDWVSDKGHWQVETNIRSPWNSIIYFYNNDGIMVYKENVDGISLNLQKKSTLRRLKKLLDRSVTAWESGHPVKEDQLASTRWPGKN